MGFRSSLHKPIVRAQYERVQKFFDTAEADGATLLCGGRDAIDPAWGDGYKKSGYGREKGIEALHHYTQLKCVSVKL